MPATYGGSVTVGGGIPAVAAEIGAVVSLLNDTNSILASLRTAIQLQADATLAAKVAIRIPAVLELQAQLNAAIDLQAELGLSIDDPLAYFQGILTGIAQVQAQLLAGFELPSIELTAQIGASVALGAEMGIRIGMIDLQLELLVQIAAVLEAQIQILINLLAQLQARLNVLVALMGNLATAGMHAFVYDGPLEDFGAEVDLATPAAGIAGSVNVRIPFFVTELTSPAFPAMNAVFKVS